MNTLKNTVFGFALVALVGIIPVSIPSATAQDQDTGTVTETQPATDTPATDVDVVEEEELSMWEKIDASCDAHDFFYVIDGEMFQTVIDGETGVITKSVLTGLPDAKATMVAVNRVIWYAPTEGEDRQIRRLWSENGKWKSELVEFNTPVPMGAPVQFFRLQITKLRLVTLDAEGNSVMWNINPDKKTATPITVTNK